MTLILFMSCVLACVHTESAQQSLADFPFLPSQLLTGSLAFNGTFVPNFEAESTLTESLVQPEHDLIDRRTAEGWWNLYPFGEKFKDIDIADRPWKDVQIDLGFYFPFYGFRFNYTFIYPEGFVAFSYPDYVQPPYTFPNPLWPDQRDPSFIAAFLCDQSFVHVGETRLSHVWYRIITRPQYRWKQPGLDLHDHETALQYDGRVEDNKLLDEITRDVRENMVGTGGYTADYALVVTWERMGYGGQPKFLQLDEFDQIKKWQNTYQMVLTTDEHRSYVLLNYANINYTSSTSAGALGGRGGRQSAIIGFNGGNGTGFYEFPYSAKGDSYKLADFGSTQVRGRWIAKFMEDVQMIRMVKSPDTSAHNLNILGALLATNPWNSMIGGNSINVSGPCFRPQDHITMEIDEEIFDCSYINMVKARCIVPLNMVFKTGPVTFQISQDGRSYNWYSTLYIFPPALSRTMVRLLSYADRTDPSAPRHQWYQTEADNLTILWSAANISSKADAKIDLVLWGYREDMIEREYVEVGAIARQIPNSGRYTFNQANLDSTLIVGDLWRRFWGGSIQVRVSGYDWSDYGHYVMWSEPVPFGWYFRRKWEQAFGSDWATQLCIEWYNYDGLRDNFLRKTYAEIPCPCTLDQASVDFGRFTPLPTCEMMGDSSCIYTKGAQHCVVSTRSTLESGTQMCCYDFNGWLMFSQDYEFNPDYLNYFSAGVPYRANPWGGYVYKKPLYVPTWSNFYNDLLPFDLCCRWAGHCEFYYWRRPTSGCQNYEPAVTEPYYDCLLFKCENVRNAIVKNLGTAYGHGHFITFDGTKYTFNGRGHFVLVLLNTPQYKFTVQVRTEQPPRTLCNAIFVVTDNTDVAATVITGVSVRDQDSSIVQVFSRKQFRRWRYRTDVLVDGEKYFFDMDRRRFFKRVLVYVPHLVMNQSEVYIQFNSGTGVKVVERRGILQVTVALPPSYRTDKVKLRINQIFLPINAVKLFADMSVSPEETKCKGKYSTMGLLGTYNGDSRDDFTAPDCSLVANSMTRSEEYSRTIHNLFGSKWRTEEVRTTNLFSQFPQPLYYPSLFYSEAVFNPVLDPWKFTNFTSIERLIFTREHEVQVACQGVYSCTFDYLVSGRREFGVDTLEAEKKFELDKVKGEQKTISCGPLEKNYGVIKYPLGNNYLDGVAVTLNIIFTVQKDDIVETELGQLDGGYGADVCALLCYVKLNKVIYFLARTEEDALKWLTGIVVSTIIVALIVTTFLCCNRIKDRRLLERSRMKGAAQGTLRNSFKLA
ncbi:VWD and NIDO and AMOP domain containing protein [Trichuris trichiura]|uniref:VWD and NIDO and AMOP domain containing protein n=1 Tax=Trichuris trichiura TaxID=36087 RepID=A0A077Z191_TRITR|nr:VWD and NIDO and AMOP domain containing protein [Trichuris trichiura]